MTVIETLVVVQFRDASGGVMMTSVRTGDVWGFQNGESESEMVRIIRNGTVNLVLEDPEVRECGFTIDQLHFVSLVTL